MEAHSNTNKLKHFILVVGILRSDTVYQGGRTFIAVPARMVSIAVQDTYFAVKK